MNKLILAVFSTLLFSFCAAADSIKIVTVDVNRILNESTEAKSKRLALDKISLETKKKVESRKASLQAMSEKLRSSGISEDSKEADQLRSQAREFERFVKDSEDQLKREFVKTNKILTEKTMKIIEAYAKKSNINLVLDKSAKGHGPVLFGSANADITDAIIKEMNG